MPANAVVHITTDGGILTQSTATNGVSVVDIALIVDNAVTTNGGLRRVIAANTDGIVTMITNWSIGLSTGLVGTHTINVGARLVNGSSVVVSGDNTSVLQGQLTVTIIKK